MISYFIAAYCTLTTNFLSKLKSQFQFIFGQDFFPLKISPNFGKSFVELRELSLTNSWWNTCFYHYSFLTKKFPISSCKCLVCRRIFLFCRTDNFGGLPCLFFCKHSVSNIFFICLQMVALEYFQYDLTFDISE